MKLATLIPLCDALTRLLDPLVEVVVHDLTTNRIIHKSGALSKRQAGDPSLLSPDELEGDLSQIIYPKVGFDGRLIKSVSVPIENTWLICINCDVSVFSAMKKLSEPFLAMSALEGPKSLFKNDWQERLHRAIHDFVTSRHLSFAKLNQRQKKDIIKHLYDQGAFVEKNAADYVARALSVGRATVFNYLREWRTK